MRRPSLTLASEDDFDGWRDAARALAEAGVPPAAVVWRVGGRRRRPVRRRGAAAEAARASPSPAPSSTLAKSVVCHSDPERFALLYALLWQLRAAPRTRWRTAPIHCSTGSSGWPRRSAATCTRCMPSSASARSSSGRDHALRRLVRARASYRPPHRRLLRAPLRQHALVDPDARAFDPLGRRNPERRPGRDPRRRARRRSARGDVEDLLRVHLQPGPAEGRRDAQGDAEEILEKHAGDRARSAADCRRPREGDRDDRKSRASRAAAEG